MQHLTSQYSEVRILQEGEKIYFFVFIVHNIVQISQMIKRVPTINEAEWTVMKKKKSKKKKERM